MIPTIMCRITWYTIGNYPHCRNIHNQINGGAFSFSSSPRLITLYTSCKWGQNRGVTFPMPWDRLDSTFHYPFEKLYKEPLGTLKRYERIESKETIVHCYRNLCLSLHPFVSWSTFVFFPSFPFACEIAIERWRIEVVEAQVGDSVSPVRRRADRGCIL